MATLQQSYLFIIEKLRGGSLAIIEALYDIYKPTIQNFSPYLLFGPYQYEKVYVTFRSSVIRNWPRKIGA
jgi:hypothetical protein